jgi:putative sterol carrier protein
VRPGTTIEWEFADSAPWHVVLGANGDTRAVAGRASHADLTLHCRFADWADVMAGRADPRALVLRRRLRPRGSVRVLLAMPRVFG